MKQLFQRLFAEPTREHYLQTLAALQAAQEPSLTPAELAAWAEQLTAATGSAALASVQQLPKGAALSPRVHFLAAQFADRCGASERAELERFLFQACLRSILSTGDGGSSHPYVVCQVSDEQDVLLALGETSVQLRVQQLGAQTLDRHLCASGREVCFDISHALAAPVLTAAPAAEPACDTVAFAAPAAAPAEAPLATLPARRARTATRSGRPTAGRR